MANKTAKDVMTVAERYIGTKESPAGSNNVVFNTDYYGHPVSGADYPWCCTTIWDVFRIAGASKLFYDGKKTAYCPTYESWALSAGLSVGKNNGTYGDVATMDFGKGRASHIGFILKKNADGTYQTIEGNTSLTSQDNGGAVMERTRPQSVIRYIFRPKYAKEEKALTETQWINAVRNVYMLAYKGKFKYGDSHAMPPCSDKIISCDRLVARACYDLGWKSQPNGGITVLNMGSFLLKWGFKKITKQADLKAGDVVLFKWNGQSKPTAQWHTFVLTAYNPKTAICSKYDEGSDSRIVSVQPFKNVPLNEWVGQRSFYCGFRPPYKSEVKRLPTDGKTTYEIVSALNKKYVMDIKGGSMEPKANVQLHTSNGTEAQAFVVEDVKDGYVRIVNKKSGLVFDLAGGKVANGTNIRQYEWNGTDSQLWKMRMNADMTVTFESAKNNGYVIDAKGGKAVNGTNVQLYKNNGTKAQKWNIK